MGIVQSPCRWAHLASGWGVGRVFREGGSDDDLPRDYSKKVKHELKEDRSSYERWVGRGAREAKISPHSQLTPVC